MKTSRKFMVGGASIVILGAGFAAAPEAAVLVLAGQPTADASSAPEDTSAAPSATPPATPTPAPTSDGSEASTTAGTFVGPIVTNLRGDYQLQIIVADGKVADVEFLTAGTDASQSVSVNAMALPILRERILEAQDWDVEYVSGSSFTSPAMIESAQGAFDDAGL